MKLGRFTVPPHRYRLWLPLLPLAFVWPGMWVVLAVLYLISREQELELSLHGRLERAALRARARGWPLSPGWWPLFLLPLAILWPWLLLVVLYATYVLRSWERDADQSSVSAS